MFRHKSSPGSSRKDPVQEEIEQSDKTSIQAFSEVCVSSNKPVISSPVSHLWNNEDGVTPLVRPEDAKSTGIYVLSLHCFKESSYSALRLPVWDVAKEKLNVLMYSKQLPKKLGYLLFSYQKIIACCDF